MPQSPQSQQVRVFISSPFRDMQVERDVLVKQVFPELRRRCTERGVDFVEVDLRWAFPFFALARVRQAVLSRG